MFGQAISLLNNLKAGRVTGAPWWRNVRKGMLVKMTKDSYGMKETRATMLSAYKRMKNDQTSDYLKSGLAYLLEPAAAFRDRYKALTNRQDDMASSNFMFFMYNPTSWNRTTSSGLQEVNIPGGRPVYHQASIPPQNFSLSLLLDNSVWFNSDTFLEEMKDHAIGALTAAPRAVGSMENNAGTGVVDDLGLRELQFYHSNDDTEDPQFQPEANLAPIINWYERLAVPDPDTLVQPVVLVAYQDLFARCIVRSVKTSILRSDWRQNINRAQLDIDFTVLHNQNLYGQAKKSKELFTATRP